MTMMSGTHEHIRFFEQTHTHTRAHTRKHRLRRAQIFEVLTNMKHVLCCSVKYALEPFFFLPDNLAGIHEQMRNE